MAHWMDLPLRSIGRLAWSKSLLTRHPGAHLTRGQLSLATFLLSVKEFFSEPLLARPVPLDTRPRLQLPQPPAVGSFQPPRYFSQGISESDRRKNPTPIRYLLTESLELPVARPAPHNSTLIRSLCKGRGVLRQNRDGLLYLDIDNRFILAMMPYLRFQGLIRPPYFNLFGPSIGAHVPVVSKREASFHYLSTPKEIGQEFTFEIEGLYSLKPDTWPEVEAVWFFKLHSPQLEALRQRYQLLSKPNGHDFHIVVAVEPKQETIQDRRPVPLMRINTAFLVA